jgi:hypothetical protein
MRPVASMLFMMSFSGALLTTMILCHRSSVVACMNLGTLCMPTSSSEGSAAWIPSRPH